MSNSVLKGEMIPSRKKQRRRRPGGHGPEWGSELWQGPQAGSWCGLKHVQSPRWNSSLHHKEETGLDDFQCPFNSMFIILCLYLVSICKIQYSIFFYYGASHVTPFNLLFIYPTTNDLPLGPVSCRVRRTHRFLPP